MGQQRRNAVEWQRDRVTSVPMPTTPAPDDRRAAAVCLLHLPGLALLAAFIPGAPPPRCLSLIHAVGVVMVAARVLFSGRRFGAIADIGESGAATAIRRAMLLCSLLGSVVRFLLVIPRQGRHFWAAARAQLVTNALVVGLGCLLLRAVESPDAYPLGISFAGAMAISSLAVYAAALRPANVP